MGLAYERDLAKCCPSNLHGQWFAFEDRAGLGYCQPDIIMDTTAGIAVLESKYTWTEQGHLQIERLYRPVLELAYGRPVYGLVVCKVLVSGLNRDMICNSLPKALALAATGRRAVLHWIGGLGPLQGCLLPRGLAGQEARI